MARLMHATLTILATTVLFYIVNLEEASKSAFNKAKKKVVLIASSEAPIGGIFLALYKDSTYELGNFRQVESTGIFKLKTDTLFLTPADTSHIAEKFSETSFIMKGKELIEIQKTGIGWLEIHGNKLK